MKQHIKLADLEIPKNIWDLTNEERLELNVAIKEFLESIVERELRNTKDKKMFLIKLIESTMIVNEHSEQYEICAVMKDIKEMIENE